MNIELIELKPENKEIDLFVNKTRRHFLRWNG